MAAVDLIKNTLVRTLKFGPYIPLSQIFVAFFGRFLKPEVTNNIGVKRNTKIQNEIAKRVTFDDTLCNVNVDVSAYDPHTAPIWFCWLQGEDAMPPVVKFCLTSIRKHANGHSVIVLNERNYTDYVKMPQKVVDLFSQGKIKGAHFADIMRINLLAQQGGLWLDATIFLSNDIPDEVFDLPFFSIKIKPYGSHASKCRWSVFCLGAHKGNVIFTGLARLFDEYLSNESVFVDYFMFDNLLAMMYDRYPKVMDMIDAVPMNNLDVYAFAKRLCEDYDNEFYNKVTSNTYIFKLDWKKFSEEQLLMNPESYYCVLSKATDFQ